MRCSPIVFLLLAPLLVLQFQPGLCAPAAKHSNDRSEKDDHDDPASFAEEGEDEDEDDEDEDNEGVEADFLEEGDDEANTPAPDVDGEDGEPPDDHPMNQNRRRGVLEGSEDPTEAPLAEEEVPATTTTTPYPLGVIGPDPLAVDPEHEQQLGPVQSWPQGGSHHWAAEIASERPHVGVMPITECKGRRRTDRRRDTCKGNYRRRRRTDYVYGDRATEECASRRRVSERRRICESYGTRRRRSRRRDPELARRRRTRRRRIENVAAAHSHPHGDRRRRYAEGDGLHSSFSLQEDDPSVVDSSSAVLADGSISQNPDKTDTSKSPDYASLGKMMTSDPRAFDKAFKEISSDAGHLLDASSDALKQLGENLKSSDNASVSKLAKSSSLEDNADSASEGLTAEDVQAALLRRHIN